MPWSAAILLPQLAHDLLGAHTYLAPDEIPRSIGTIATSVCFWIWLLGLVPLIVIGILRPLLLRVPREYHQLSPDLLWTALVPFAAPLLVWIYAYRINPTSLGEFANSRERNVNREIQRQTERIKASLPKEESQRIGDAPRSYLDVGDCGRNLGALWGICALGLYGGLWFDYLKYGFGLAFLVMAAIYLFSVRMMTTRVERMTAPVIDESAEDEFPVEGADGDATTA